MATRLHIKICEARNVLKMDVGGKSDPYVTLRLKSQDKKDYQKTQIISNNSNPVWNQEFDITATDPNDMLLINMYDEDIKMDDKMMDELQYPVNSWPVGGPVDRKEIDIKLKKKNAGKLVFEVQAFPAGGYASGVSERAVNLGGVDGTNGCLIQIKAFDASDVLKMDTVGKSDPYLRFRLKDKKESTVKTQIISNTKNPVWNEELSLYSFNRNADVLEVDMLDEDIKKDDKMMDRIEIPLRDHPIGEHYVFNQNINLKKKDAGRLHFEINFLPGDGNGSAIQSRDAQLGQSYGAHPGHLKIRAVNGTNLKKMDTAGKSDPYMTFGLKGRSDSKVKTQVISNNCNPVWNEDLTLDVPDIKNDVLLVNLWDEDLKKDDRMMNEQSIPLSSVPIGQRQVFNNSVNLKNKDAGNIHYEYVLNEGSAAEARERDISVAQPCKVIVHAIKGEKLRKQDTQTTDPYLTLQLKEDPNSLKRTRAINHDLNPVWNQTFELHSKDWNSDALVVNMANQSARHNGDKMMNEVELPLRNWPIGTHIDYQEDVCLKKKKAGRVYLGIDVLNEDQPPVAQRAVEETPVQSTQELTEQETETETIQPTETETLPPTETETETLPPTETETETIPPTETETETEVTQSRGINLDDPSGDYCDFTWGEYDSRYSTDFTGYTQNSSSLSNMRSTEERFHHHHRIHPENDAN
ncbi:hypothetical protein M9Y10_024649 [Tritrichomonas musculus]|uniref:C2 domain-containing protein n=1 Tax=Tritrichomonas musculus TaxID=1915356 RepID=A0ABR2HAV5_9EUKA